MSNPTISETVSYVMKNRKGNAFKDYSEGQIATLLRDYVALTACDDNNKLVGVVCAVPYPLKKKLFIHEILTTEPWVLKSFVAHFMLRYSGWSLEAMRRGKFVEYDTMKLTQKISRKEQV